MSWVSSMRLIRALSLCAWSGANSATVRMAATTIRDVLMVPAMIQPAVMKTLIFGMLAALAAQSPSGLVTQKSLSLGLAKTMAEAALAECKTKGFNTSVVVVDRAGQTIVSLRDENASAQTMEMARRKAYTARMFRLPTLEFQKRTEDPKYKAQRDVADILALGG